MSLVFRSKIHSTSNEYFIIIKCIKCLNFKQPIHILEHNKQKFYQEMGWTAANLAPKMSEMLTIRTQRQNLQTLMGSKSQVCQFFHDRTSESTSSQKVQMVSVNSFPKNKKSVVLFQLEQYGEDREIGFGILLLQRREEENSGRHKGSVGYFTISQPGGFGNKGFICADEKFVENQQWRENWYIPKGGVLQMQVQLKNRSKKLTFINKSNKKTVQIELSEEYMKTEVFAFCNMYCKGDTVRILS